MLLQYLAVSCYRMYTACYLESSLTTVNSNMSSVEQLACVDACIH